jgi:hypothetical protein
MKTERLKTISVIFLVMLSGFCMAVSAQNRTVKGRIVDEQNEELADATVQLKGTNAAAVSNATGDYTLTVPSGSKNPVLVFSYVGFLPSRVRKIIICKDSAICHIFQVTNFTSNGPPPGVLLRVRRGDPVWSPLPAIGCPCLRLVAPACDFLNLMTLVSRQRRGGSKAPALHGACGCCKAGAQCRQFSDMK